MLDTYRRVLGIPGARAFSAAAFIGRAPIAMIGLSVVFLVAASTDSYGTAGAMSATLLVATSVAAPVHARLAERVGQNRVVLFATVAHTTAVLGFVVALRGTTNLPSAFAAVAVAGASLPQLAAFVRRRWVHVLADRAQVQTAYAWESILDEVIFISGPILVTLVAVNVSPEAAVLGTLAFTVVGGVLFGTRRDTEPRYGPTAAAEEVPATSVRPVPAPTGASSGVPEKPQVAPRASQMPWLRVGLLSASSLALGTAFGAIELSAVAHTDAVGQPAAAALILACFAGGSLVAGIIAGARQWRVPTVVRYPVGLALLAVALLPMTAVTSPVGLILLIAVAGLTVAPTLIAGYSLVAELVAPRRLTEGLAYFGTALGLGVALGAAASGPLADADRALLGFGVAAAGAAVGSTAGLLLAVTVRRRGDAGTT
jgi:hypothetical protein